MFEEIFNDNKVNSYTGIDEFVNEMLQNREAIIN